MKDLGQVIKLIMMEKRDVFLSVLFGVITGLAAVGLFASSGYLISKAALAPPLYTLTIVIATVKLLGFTRAFSRYGERLFSHRATFTMLSNLRVSFYKKIEPLAPNLLQKYRSGDLLSRIVGDVETLQNFFLRVVYPPIVLVIVFLSTILFTMFYAIEIALVLALGLILTTFVVPFLFTMARRKVEWKMRKSRGDFSTEVTEFLYGFRDLKIYQQLEGKKEQLVGYSDDYITEQEREGVHQVYSDSVNTFVSLFISWLVIAVGAFLVTEGQLDGIFLAMLVMISLTVFENAGSMAVFPSHLEDSRLAAKRLYSVVERPGILRPENAKQLPSNQPYSIDAKDISFSFSDELRNTINQASLSLPAGSNTAIVGPSGSGKSTLFELFLKMHELEKGEICLDGIPADQLSQETIWENTNVVLQKNHFFYGTIRENLLLAREEASDLEMEAVLSNVLLDPFSLDDPVLEKGENLSGGEKQRLAIARAMLKNSSVWLLDEPTSSIDALTEETIYRHLFEKAKDDTVVLISHRLTGMENMDQIIVMEQGEIIEVGTFEELMDLQGYFYQMKQIEKSVFM
ncbi:thiol reductant ABC exporter subunit CydC [Virgibacillus byunsanensis]|uniref:Thiol reductant ABC exporter subunit CydC n=1 Tax=Virgibacillus byunsanensis TaxID=570945 RepID=A0ABW3LS85_9BACI